VALIMIAGQLGWLTGVQVTGETFIPGWSRSPPAGASESG
jgi:hypothetical protein